MLLLDASALACSDHVQVLGASRPTFLCSRNIANGQSPACERRTCAKELQTRERAAWLFRDVLSGETRATRSGRAHGVMPEGVKWMARQALQSSLLAMKWRSHDTHEICSLPCLARASLSLKPLERSNFTCIDTVSDLLLQEFLEAAMALAWPGYRCSARDNSSILTQRICRT